MHTQATYQPAVKPLPTNSSVTLPGRASRPLPVSQPRSNQPIHSHPRPASTAPQSDDGRSQPHRAPTLAYYRPTAKGTGVAIRIQAPSNGNSEDTPPAAFFEMARQKTPFGRGPDGGRIAATFDWESKLTVRLDSNELFALLAVIERRIEAVGPEGAGLHHRHGERTTIIQFAASRERGGYQFQLSRSQGGDRNDRLAITLSEPEACGWRCFIEALVNRWVGGGTGAGMGIRSGTGASQRTASP